MEKFPNINPEPVEENTDNTELPRKSSGGIKNWIKKGVAMAGIAAVGVGAYEGGKSIKEGYDADRAEFDAKVTAAGGVEKYEAQIKKEDQESGEKYWNEQLGYYYSRLDSHPTNPEVPNIVLDPMHDMEVSAKMDIEAQARAIEILKNKGYQIEFGKDYIYGKHPVLGGLSVESYICVNGIKIPSGLRYGIKSSNSDMYRYEVVAIEPSDYSEKELLLMEKWKVENGYNAEIMKRVVGFDVGRDIEK